MNLFNTGDGKTDVQQCVVRLIDVTDLADVCEAYISVCHIFIFFTLHVKEISSDGYEVLRYH